MKKGLVGGLALALALTVGQAANAATTAVTGTSLVDALRAAYGYTVADGGSGTGPAGTFSFGTGINSITFTRVDDGAGLASFSPVPGATGDTSFTLAPATTGQFRVEAKISGTDPIHFGTTTDGGTTLSEILAPGILPATNSNTYPSALGSFSTANPFQFYIQGTSVLGQAFKWVSDPTKNSGSEDHEVTYIVSGLDKKNGVNVSGFVLAWEDLPFNTPTDADYQDLVVQVTSSTGVVPTPLPAAVWGGASLFGMLGGARLFRRRRA